MHVCVWVCRPVPNFYGTVTLSFVATDGVGSSSPAISIVTINVSPVFDPPSMSNIEASTLTYTEGSPANTLPISATVTMSSGDSIVTELRLMVTQGYAATDLALLVYVVPSPPIAYDYLVRGTTLYGGSTVGMLSLSKASGFSYVDAQRILRAFAYLPDMGAPDVVPKRFALYAAALPIVPGHPTLELTQFRYFQVCGVVWYVWYVWCGVCSV